jgi:hypothetical protein
MIRTNIDRLVSQLNTSGLQQQNPALYQVIQQLIALGQQLITQSNSSAGSSSSQAIINSILAANFLMSTDESIIFPNSRNLLAGQNIAFDDSTPNERTISTGNWSVLTNGDPVTPELIFAGGDVIMVYTP